MDQRRRRRRRRRPRHLAEFVRPGGRAEEAGGGSALVQGGLRAWPITWRRGLLATGRSDQPAEATREYSAVPYVVCVTHSVPTVHYVH